MREVGRALGYKLSRYENELAAKNQYRNAIRSKVALVVVDDVWRVGCLEPLLAESPRSRLLFTTRDGKTAGSSGCSTTYCRRADRGSSLVMSSPDGREQKRDERFRQSQA